MELQELKGYFNLIFGSLLNPMFALKYPRSFIGTWRMCLIWLKD